MKEYKAVTSEKTLKVCDRNIKFQKAQITKSIDAEEYIRKFYNDDIEIVANS